MSQNHFTLNFPLKSPAAAKALAEQLPPLMPDLFRANDAIGTVHYSRFTVLSEKTLLFLGDFDGEFDKLMADLARLAGPVFDAIFRYVDGPPPAPAALNADAFVKWMRSRLITAVNLYTAYPSVTAGEVKTLAAVAGISGVGELHPFLVILPIRSYLHFIAVQLILRARGKVRQRISTRWARLTLLNSFRLRTIRSVSLPSTMARLTNTSLTLPRTSERSSTSYSNSPKTRRRHRAGSTCRNLWTLRPVQIAHRSGSIRLIRDYPFRTFMP
jgi:hypothetical protein